jgi:hypothetical protein
MASAGRGGRVDMQARGSWAQGKSPAAQRVREAGRGAIMLGACPAAGKGAAGAEGTRPRERRVSDSTRPAPDCSSSRKNAPARWQRGQSWKQGLPANPAKRGGCIVRHAALICRVLLKRVKGDMQESKGPRGGRT